MLNQIKQLQEIIETQEEIMVWCEFEINYQKDVHPELFELLNKLKTLKENYHNKYKIISE